MELAHNRRLPCFVHYSVVEHCFAIAEGGLSFRGVRAHCIRSNSLVPVPAAGNNQDRVLDRCAPVVVPQLALGLCEEIYKTMYNL